MTATPEPAPCALSVIVAQADRDAALGRSIAALERACAGLGAEIVLVRSVEEGATPVISSTIPVRTICVAGGALVPQLWTRGLSAARGTSVAFTLASCEVAPDWAARMISALGGGADGVGGPFERDPGLGVVDRALYYLRYSAFLPALVRDGVTAGEIAADNAAYRREALDRHRAALSEGFWEVLFHRDLRRHGGSLALASGAATRFIGGVRLTDALRHRFAHGRHFGAWRAGSGQRPAWLIALASPLVPVVLARRAAGRVFRAEADRWPFLSSLPVFLGVASAWAFGEAVGAFAGAALPHVRDLDADGTGALAATGAVVRR